MHTPILIPTFNPDHRLTQLVEALIAEGVRHIVVVNDGSRSECNSIFEQLKSHEQCTLLHHAVNCGKGRALKTGLNHIYMAYPEAAGAVTADGDGQHRTEDILQVATELERHPGKLVMGARKMGKEVPFRSLFGNVLTRFVFSFLVGKKVADTQSGLRGLPRSAVPELLRVNGERYEYEINMLIMTKRQNIDIVEVPIETVYIDENKSSHFNPLVDSMRIYFQLLRFAFSSLIASVFDFIVFTVMYRLSGNIVISLLAGRFVVGSLLNYVINRRLVFHSSERVWSTLSRYYFALVAMSLVSYLLIRFVVIQWGFKITVAKIVVETCLFVFSFLVQREFVFGSKEE
jgi:glycosyltransferase involved in cell wall biosynthesis